MIIDIHTHVGDCLTGGELSEPYERPPRLLSDLFEASGFRLMGGRRLFPRLSHYVEIIHNQERNNLGTPQNLLHYMDRFDVSVSVLQPIEPYRSTADNLALAGERLRTFASVHPAEPGWEKRLEGYMHGGCVGLKIHPILQRLAPGDPAVYSLFEEYAPYGRPVLLHGGESSYRIGEISASRLGRIADWEPVFTAFPSVRFIVGHMAMEGWREAIALGERLANIYTDTSFQPASHVREALSRMGKERVLYASDWPFSIQKAPLRVIDSAVAGDAGLRRALLSGNAVSLLGVIP
jgi:predicted TIM-barrel fold metal-dependent hydrolase